MYKDREFHLSTACLLEGCLKDIDFQWLVIKSIDCNDKQQEFKHMANQGND